VQPTVVPTVQPTPGPTVQPTVRPTFALSMAATASSYSCFATRTDLDTAIASDYTDTGSEPHLTYGPIDDWCFDASITDFSLLFFDKTIVGDLNSWVSCFPCC